MEAPGHEFFRRIPYSGRCSIYIDGEAVDAEATFLGNPYSLGPVVGMMLMILTAMGNDLPSVSVSGGKIRVETHHAIADVERAVIGWPWRPR